MKLWARCVTFFNPIPFLLFLGWSSVSLSAPSYITFPADIDWVARTSSHFEVIYRRGSDRLGERALLAAERAYRLLEPYFEDKPELTRIVIADFAQSLNGYSIDFPYPHIVVYAAPPDATGDLATLDNWFESVILHEFVHTLHLYPANWIYKPMRWVFGSWVIPNGMLPTHLHEGLATYLETEKSMGGRGRSPTFAMYRRMAVEHGAWKHGVPLDRLEGLSTHWPGGSSPYFYGQYFYRHLVAQKGVQGIRDWVRATSGQFPYWVSESTSPLFGKSYAAVWRDIFAEQNREAQEEIRKITLEPLSKLDFVTQSRFWKWDLTVSPDGKHIAYRESSPEKATEVVVRELDEKGIGKVEETLPGSGKVEGLCWTPNAEKEGGLSLLLAEMRPMNYYEMYQATELRLYDLATKKSKTVEAGEKFRAVHALGCSVDSPEFAVYEERAGEGSVAAYRWGKGNRPILKRSWTVPEGAWVSSILVDSHHVSFLLRAGTTTQFYTWSNGPAPVPGVRLPGHFHNLRAGDGKHDFFAVGAIDGRDEVWGIFSNRREAARKVAVLGGVNGFDRRGDRWWVTAYRHGGYDVASASASPGVTRRLHADAGGAPVESDAERVPAATSMSAVREYSPWSTLWPRSWLPSMLLVPNGLQISAFVPGFDVSQTHSYNFFGGYDTRGSPFVDFVHSYRFGKTWSIDSEPYYIPTYLISTQQFLPQWGVSSLVGVGPGFLPFRIAFGPVFRRLEPTASTGANQSVGVQISLSRNLGFRREPLAIAPSRGTRLSLSHTQYLRELGSQDAFYSTVLAVDQFIAAPWWSGHVFLLSFHNGFTEGTSLLNSFYQGGGELQFSAGQGLFLNRGFLPGTFLSQRMSNITFEYRFPIARIDKGWGIAPFFVHNIQGAIVCDNTTAFRTEWWRTFYTSVGAELKTDWTMSFYFPVRVRVGGYHGFGVFGEPLYVTLAIEAGL